MKKHENGTSSNAQADMTPMLDIVFILLIFFIVTTSFINEKGLLINKASQNSITNQTNKNIIIKIMADKSILFNESLVDIERLSARVESFLAKNNNASTVVLAQKTVTMSHLVAVIDQLKAFDHLPVSIGKPIP